MDMEIISNAHYQDMAITQPQQQQQQQENKKPRPHPEQALPCPRCESTNTKFCYYNNYSLSQPRYFCKACRRYWTRGGSLRNVPMGGGCRKNNHHHNKMKTKKPSSSSSTSPSSSSPSSSSSSSPKQTLELDLTPNININMNPLLPLSFDHIDMINNFMLPYPNPSPKPIGFLDILRGTTNGGHVDHTMQSLYFDQMFPVNVDDGGLLNSANVGTATATAKATMVAMDQEGDNELVDNVNVEQWGQLIGGDHGSNLGMDSVRDQYWNNNNYSNGWQGLINSSLM